MKYLIYARVSPKGSTWSSSESSLDMQIAQCKNYIRENEYTIIRDEFYTAKDSKRPGLQQIISQLQSGNADWDTLIVYKLDRLTRSLRDGGEIFELLTKDGKGFISVTENIDMSTPVGRAMLWIIHVFAQLEREQLAERTRDKMVSIAAGGEYAPGLTPLGYMRPAKHCNTLIIEPKGAAIVRDIYRSYIAGETTTALAKRHGIGIQSVCSILRNRHYLGVITYAGQEYRAKHPALISAADFAAVQSRMPVKSTSHRPAAQKYPYLLTGLMRCSCGRHMTAKSATGSKAKFHYYNCTDINCRHAVNAEKLEKAVMQTIGQHAIDTNFLEDLCHKIGNVKDTWLTQLAPEQADLDRAKRSHIIERNSIDQAFLSGIVTKDNAAYWNSKLSAVNNAIQNIDCRLEELRQASNIDMGIFSEAKALANHLNHLQELLKFSGSDNLKREAALTYIKEIRQLSVNEYEIEMNYSSLNSLIWLPRKELKEQWVLRFFVA